MSINVTNGNKSWPDNTMKRFWIRRGLRFLGFAIFFVGLVGLAIMTLWNALLPAILGVTTITFWQALGLFILSRILFGGFRGYSPRGRYGRRGFRGGWADPGQTHPGRGGWKQKMAERWQQLTPEQRDRMKAEWRNRCGKRGRGWWGEEPEQPGQQPFTDTNAPTGSTGPTTI